MREGFIPKRCIKCGGNIYVERDYYGWFEKCLQCGYTSELPSIAEVRKNVNKAGHRQAQTSKIVK